MTTPAQPDHTMTASTPRKPARRRAVEPAPRAPAPARYAAPLDVTDRSGGQALAALLRLLRAEHGLTVSRLAERAVVDRRTLQRLELGQLRPRPSTLYRIANALDPNRGAEILDSLTTAAGDWIAQDSGGWSRYSSGRVSEAVQAGRWRWPSASERAVRLFTASESMWQAAREIRDSIAPVLNAPGSRVADYMDLASALQDESELLAKDAGGVWKAAPPPRRRGDPPDVSPYAPSVTDRRAMWRWLREWQCREGRLSPRSARERAVAETGARERDEVQRAPGPPPVRAEDIPLGEGDGRIRHLVEGSEDHRPVRHVIEEI